MDDTHLVSFGVADANFGFMQVVNNFLVWRQGFEPGLADPETAVLPLDDLPT